LQALERTHDPIPGHEYCETTACPRSGDLLSLHGLTSVDSREGIERGRVEFVSAGDRDALDGYRTLCREEGIIPALESAHAVAYGIQAAASLGRKEIMVINISGRGGAAGIIIPDLPQDEIDEDLPAVLSEHGLAHVPVLSPGMRPDRIRTILEGASGFVYVTLKTGVTGALSEIGGRGLEFLDVVRKATPLPIAAGFGISSPEHIRLLEGKADAVVVGSRVIDLFNREGLDGVRAFLEGCRAELSQGGYDGNV